MDTAEVTQALQVVPAADVIKEITPYIQQSNQLSAQLNASLLWIVGVGASAVVIFVLYKFLRKFF